MGTIGRNLALVLKCTVAAAVLLLLSVPAFARGQGGGCAQTRYESIQSDSQHYLPGETVVITGGGFAASCDVLIVVNYPDGTSEQNLATSDAYGNLAYFHSLGPVTGDYSIQVETTDGAVSLALAPFSSGVFVTTDKPDYKPGETVTFSGRGYGPNELVSLVVRQNYPGGLPDRVFSALADASGAFVSSEFVVGEQDLNTTMVVTAGGRAETMFSDAAAVFVNKEVNQTTITVAASITAVYAPAPTAGNLLVAIVGSFGPATVIGAPAGWSTAINQPATATTPAQAIFYKLSAGAGDASVTATFTPASTGTITLQEFSNILASSDPFDGSNSSTGGSTAAASTGTLTPTSGFLTDLLIGGVSAESTTNTLLMAATSVTGGFLVELPNATINGGGAGTQRIASQSADRKTSPAGSSTGFTISGTGVPGSILGWRGQIAAFQTKLDAVPVLSAAPPSPAPFGQPVTFTATLFAGPTGSVTFKDGATPICSNVPLSGTTAQCTTSRLSIATHSITATYNGDSTYAASTSAPLSYVIQAPAAACFRSLATGDWNQPSSWEQAAPVSGACTAVTWGAATSLPNNNAVGIQIRSPHTITVTVGDAIGAGENCTTGGVLCIDQTTIDAGGQVTVAGGQVLTLVSGAGAFDLAVNGHLQVNGTLTLGDSSAMDIAGTATVASGGVVGGGGGSGSTSPDVTISGTMTVDSGGLLTGSGVGPVYTVNSGGVLNVDGSVGGNVTTLIINSGGQANVTGSVILGSISNLQVSGTFALSGTGNVSLSRGNGGTLGSVNNGGVLSLADSSTFSIIFGTASYSIASGGTLDMGPSAIVNGTGSLIAASGANLQIGSADGIVHSTTLGNVRTSSGTADSYSIAANYTYDGTAAQATGNALPTTVNNLTIANTGGAVTPTSNVRTDGTLSVLSGATFQKFGAFTLTTGVGGVSNAGTIELSGTTSACGETDNLLIRSSVLGTQRSWSGAGTFTISDVDVQDQAGSASITALSSTNSGNNGGNWTFAACGPCEGQLAGFVCRPSAGACDVAESCDGVSNNCPVDGFAAAGTACGSASDTECDNPDTCNGSGSCQLNNAANGTFCGDAGTECTNQDTCSSGVCADAGFKTAGAACGDGSSGACDNADSCDGAGSCQVNHVASGTSCSDGNACTSGETCNGSGACAGGSAVDPNDNNPCTSDSCDPLTGVHNDPVANGTSCDDSTVCNGSETCQNGSCVPGTPVIADDGNPCTVDSCDPVLGAQHTPGNAGALCRASTGACDVADYCDGASPACPDAKASAGTSCSDNNACTQSDQCDSSGTCAPGPLVVCTALDQCHDAGVCNPGTGVCSNPAKADGSACSDGNACTQTDTCQTGACSGSNPVVCSASDQCHDAGVCNPGTGVCSNPAKADGSACSDGNSCTQTDTCQAGACSGSNPVVCSASDQCHDAGVCDTGTGVCSNPAKADGSACSDGNACTQTDTCQAGACSGSNPVVCSASDQCHEAGVCDTGTGVCSNPAKADGSSCNDGDACTSEDSCQSGSCTGTPYVSTACNTGNPGVCAAGTTSCSAGIVTCNQTTQASAETCDGLDNDCNGQVDNVAGIGTACSGPGVNTTGVCTAAYACTGAAGPGPNGLTCTQQTGPSAEICDNLDNDCNGTVDNNPTDVGEACASNCPGGLLANCVGQCQAGTTACQSGVEVCSGSVGPSAETCDGADNDCNGQVDDGISGVGDACSGPGVNTTGVCTGAYACTGSSGPGPNGLTCTQQTGPTAEVCNGLDDNCNGAVDDSPTDVGEACASSCPGGLLANCVGQCQAGTTVCQGGVEVCSGSVGPSTETCDGVDNDCDGLTDENITQSCYDGPAGTDGVGLCHGGTQTCSAGSFGACMGQVTPASETCDGNDNDCDGSTDEGVTSTFYRDVDSDGYGNPASSTQACSQPSGYVSNNTDCDDIQATAHPGGSEVCGNGIDEDCNGVDSACGNVCDGNLAPEVTGTAGPDPRPVGNTSSWTVTATFIDAGPAPYTCLINWGDSQTSSGTVTYSSGTGTCTGTHTYSPAPTSPNVYSVTFTITDDCNASGQSTFFVVYYDPSAGFVTGGGWINSPQGAYDPDPNTPGTPGESLTGKANFGFVSKYQKGQTIPTGETQFHFNAGGFKFDSDSYEWLVISGAKARYRGTGKVNGGGSYGFELTAWDGALASNGPDKFRIRIWDQNQGNGTVYDNMRGEADGVEPTGPGAVLGGGSIVIHKK